MVGNGSIRLPLNKRQYLIITGGPFKQCPDDFRGVKMAAEIQKDCAVDIPTQDYNVPPQEAMYRGLETATRLILNGEPLYVGCMGGIGRTGLFLAVLAKAFGIKDPVAFVRANYIPHAVETPQQKEYVRKFIVSPQVRILLKNARSWKNLHCLMFWKHNMTRLPMGVLDKS